MDMDDRLQKFNQRWKISPTESYEESFRKFKIRILNIFKNVDSHVSKKSIRSFCQVLGINEKLRHDMFGSETGHGTNIEDRLKEEGNEIQFYKTLEVVFTLQFPGLYTSLGQTRYTKGEFYAEVCQAIKLSCVNLATSVVKNDEIIFYPAGETTLDIALVDNTFSFLNDESSKHFLEALKFYQTKEHVKSAESLRRSLEEFLRFKMKNIKGLDANISDLKNQLKTDNCDSRIKKIILQTCDYLDKYFNENSKHNDGEINDTENEFLIYQTGVIMRYLNEALPDS